MGCVHYGWSVPHRYPDPGAINVPGPQGRGITLGVSTTVGASPKASRLSGDNVPGPYDRWVAWDGHAAFGTL